MAEKATKKVQKPRKKREKPVYNAYLYAPALQEASPWTIRIGYAFRALIVYIMALGMTLFIADAFRAAVSVPLLMLVLLVCCALYAFMGLSLRNFLIGAALAAIGIGLWAVPPAHTFLLRSVGALWNQMQDRLDAAGYKTVGYLKAGFVQDSFREAYVQNGLLLLAMTLSALYALMLLRRVRLIAFAAFSGALMSMVFTYNFNSSSWGFSLMIAACCGVLSMGMFDRRYNRRRAPKKPASNLDPADPRQKGVRSAWSGGYVGMTATAVSLLLLLIPTIAVSDEWTDIAFISHPMARVRTVISAVITGENIDRNKGFLGNLDTLNSRSTAAEDRTFYGQEMLRVYSSANYPLYLRSWMAGSYDNEANAWRSPKASESRQYAEQFGDDFSPERITSGFYEIVNPRLTTLNSYTAYSDHVDDGFISATVDISATDAGGNLLFVPSVRNLAYGIMEYLSTDRSIQYGESWSNYYDGILSTGIFNNHKEYRMVAYMPTYHSEKFADRLQNNLSYYGVMKSLILQCGTQTLSQEERSSVIANAEATLENFGITYTAPCALERYLDLGSAAEKEAFVQDIFAREEAYEEFVREKYLSVPENDAILNNVTEEILRGMSERLELSEPFAGSLLDPANRDAILGAYTRHETVLRVVDYLREHYTYTLTPNVSAITRLSALDGFLYEYKEGYCVQFATAAAMILRNLGIPTRYVEGYYLSGFRYDSSRERLAKYSATARDYNAHAWIEVYGGAIGWMTYETTPAYYSELYEPFEIGSGSTYTPPVTPTTPSTPETPDEEPDDEPTPSGGTGSGVWALLVTVLCGVGLTAAAIVTVWKLNDRAVRSYEQRYESINRALRADLDESELHRTARAVGDIIWQLHAVAGCAPKKGELPEEYIRRVDDTINDSLFSFRDILRYMNAEEFGDGMERWQLREEAEYAQALWDKLTGSMSRAKLFYYQNIKRMI